MTVADEYGDAERHDWSATFGALSAAHRRAVLAALVETGPARVSEVCTHLLAAGDSHLVGDFDSDPHATLTAALYHVHLPVLTRFGFVELDDDGRVALTERARADPLLLALAAVDTQPVSTVRASVCRGVDET